MKSSNFIAAGFVFGGFLLFSHAANCQIYKCNESGRLVYSDSPCTGANMQLNASYTNVGSLREGLAAYARGDFKTANAKLTPLADNGVALAQNALGRMYLMGYGVSKDPNKALGLFKKAANSGLAAAQNNLGVMYMAGDAVKQDFPKSLEYFRKAADQGFTPAMLNLADMYSEGFGVLRDPVEASRWKARVKSPVSSSPHDEVTVRFAGSEQFENGMDRYYGGDYDRAAELLRQAAELGHPEAQLRLSLMYREGQGVQKDTSKADDWEAKARTNGRRMDDGRDRVIVNLLPPGDPRLIPPAPLRPMASPSQGMCAACDSAAVGRGARSAAGYPSSDCKCN